MPVATCPQCYRNVRIVGTPDIGDMVTCRSCDTRLEVVSTNPLELDWPYDLDDDDSSGGESEGFGIYPMDEEDEDDYGLDDDEGEDDDDDF
ncbi:MAG: hypothetical protein ACOX2L_00605 [Anaerolineae bacterium]|jgi:lysine biosynthesis protein LysW|nr:hypothetical protein [Chloroflexota bacterium]